MTIPLIRKRAKRPKTHTGCITCRARHIKCDEAKPGCMRCTKSRRECEGYTEVRGSGDGSSSASARRRVVPAFVLPKPPPTVTTTISSSSPGCRDETSRSDNDIADFSIYCNSSDADDIWTFPSSHSLSSFIFSPFLLSSPSLFPSLSAQEFSSLEFFRLKTAHELPGSRWSLGWSELALRVAMDGFFAGGGASSTAVTHVAIALGAMHRAAGGEDGDGSMKEFALKQYGLAMAGLRDHIEGMEVGGRKEGKGVETVLLVSLLFFCFEVWNGDDVRAGFHLRTGLRILREWHGPTNTIEVDESGKRSPIVIEAAPGDDMCLLTRTFVRLDGDLSIVSRGDPCLRAVVKGDIPEVFASLDEAMVHLDALTTSGEDMWSTLADVAMVELEAEGICMDPIMMICLASARSRSVDLDAHPRLMERIRNHCDSVRRCMKALAFVPVKEGEETAHLLVQIHLFVLWFDSCTWREASEMFADTFEAQFEHIIGLAERYVDLHRNGYGVRPAISIGTGLVAGVCVIAFHCRVSSIRRRCINLLKRVNLQGVFDADYLVSFVQAYIRVEESRAREILGRDEYDDRDLSPHEIPFEARVIDVELGGRLDGSDDPFYKDDVGQLVYARVNSQGTIEANSVCFMVNR